ncbi:hypothetical protein ACI48J_05680 [Paenibacillus chitinolyticus]|nr:hypothetical protein [Paenibacillus chitinolyticus]MEC0247624.1 hypothetical protein [Paenibacillus chitinolyticus]
MRRAFLVFAKIAGAAVAIGIGAFYLLSLIAFTILALNEWLG